MSRSPSKYVSVDGSVVRRLRLEHKLTVRQLAEAVKIGANTVNNIERGITQRMLAVSVKRLARVFGKEPADLYGKTEEKNPALGTMGLIEIPEEFPDSVPLQSHEFTVFNQPLRGVWADYRTETLTPSLVIDARSGKCFLSCTFTGQQVAMSSSIQLHPLNHTPRKLTYEQRAVGFAAQVVKDHDPGILALSVRIFDRKGRDWVLASRKSYSATTPAHLFPLDAAEWTPCLIDLTTQPDANLYWHLFHGTSADRAAKLQPDWSVVSRFVIHFCRLNATQVLSAGNGQILLSPIWVGTRQSIAKRLPSVLAALDHKDLGSATACSNKSRLRRKS